MFQFRKILTAFAAVSVLTLTGIAATPVKACGDGACNIINCEDCRPRGDMLCSYDSNPNCDCDWWTVVEQ